MSRPIPNTNEIKAYLHCAMCLKERPEDVSPRDAQFISVGWTPLGIQVWCNIHESNVLHIDFEGQKHPANTMTPDPNRPKILPVK